MKGAAHKWIVSSLIAGVSCMAVGKAAVAADVTDADRVFANYTRETATVPEGQIRVEIQGVLEQSEDNNPKLNVIGLPLPSNVNEVSGGLINLVGSYGFTKNAEVGFIIPGIIQSTQLDSGASSSDADIGDFLLYGKLQRSVGEYLNVGGGLQLTMPNGPVSKGFGTGDLGIDPFVSTRYTHGPWALGMHLGYNFYAGDAPGMFNYSVEGIVRPSELWAIRCEWSGDVFNQGGTRFWNAAFYPGIDLKVTDNITVRPTGIAGATKDAISWGLGVGLAMTF